jgi:hypothetical protein
MVKAPTPAFPWLDEASHALGFSHGQAMDHRLPDPSWTGRQKLAFLFGYGSGFALACELLEEDRGLELERLGGLITAEEGLSPGELWFGLEAARDGGEG